MGVDNCTLPGCLIGAQRVFIVVCLVLMWCSNSVCLSSVESEPRDAGTDQKSSGIIRLHTIKQIIDRVSESRFTHTNDMKLHKIQQIEIYTSFSRFVMVMKRWQGATVISTTHCCPLVYDSL